MIQLTCDHCNKPIKDVVYMVRVADAHDPLLTPRWVKHLHWKCIALFGRTN